MNGAGSDDVPRIDGVHPPAEPPPDEMPPGAAPPTEPVAARDAAARRRTLKIVLTLRPTGDAGYEASLGVGADGCDPELRSMVAGGLGDALDAVPALLQEAEARWHDQPRYPPARPVGRGTTTPPPTPAPPGVEVSPPARSAAPAGPASGQLPLFGGAR